LVKEIAMSLDFSINRVLSNDRIPVMERNMIRSHLYETNQFVKKYDLEDFFCGLTSLETIKPRIPKTTSLFGRELTYEEIIKKFQNIDLLSDDEKILSKIKDKIAQIISPENFDSEHGVFKFIDFNSEKNRTSITKINKINNIDYDFVPKNWINSLSVIALIKWQLFTKTIDQSIHDTIVNGINWIKNNRLSFYGNYHGWSEYSKSSEDFSLKTCETALALQTLLRAKKINLDLDLDFDPFVDTMLKLQQPDGRFATSVFRKDSGVHLENGGDASCGATAGACQFINDYLEYAGPNTRRYRDLVNAIKRGGDFLVTHGNSEGFWLKNCRPSIDFTTSAIQALIKIRELNRKHIEIDQNKYSKVIEKGLDWLANQFCVITVGKEIEYAWPDEIEINKSCERNTAYAVSTLLKAGVPRNTYIVRKSILWLLDVKPEFKFNNIYIYCAILEYLKASTCVSR